MSGSVRPSVMQLNLRELFLATLFVALICYVSLILIRRETSEIVVWHFVGVFLFWMTTITFLAGFMIWGRWRQEVLGGKLLLRSKLLGKGMAITMTIAGLACMMALALFIGYHYRLILLSTLELEQGFPLVSAGWPILTSVLFAFVIGLFVWFAFYSIILFWFQVTPTTLGIRENGVCVGYRTFLPWNAIFSYERISVKNGELFKFTSGDREYTTFTRVGLHDEIVEMLDEHRITAQQNGE